MNIWRNSNFDTTLEMEAINNNAGNPWVLLRALNDHERQVCSIFIDEKMSLFVTASFDGTANLYNLWSAKLIRSFRHPSYAPIYSVFLSQTPLAICAFFSREDHMWNAYSINGKLLNGATAKNAQEKALQQQMMTEECSHVISP